jgi:hypothetical protein
MSAAERLDVKESEDLVAFEELEGGDFSCLRAALAGRVASWRNLNRGRGVNGRGRGAVPLMILQKIQAAIAVVGLLIRAGQVEAQSGS